MTKENKMKKPTTNQLESFDSSKYFKITDDPNIKTSELLQKCKDKFSVWCLWSDEQLDKNFPPPEKETTRYFKKEIESDEDLKNMSLLEVENQGIKVITFRERILMELQYFAKKNNHLDIDNITLTSSRAVDGYAVCVRWSPGDRKFYVNGYYVRGARSSLRARRAVSLNP